MSNVKAEYTEDVLASAEITDSNGGIIASFEYMLTVFPEAKTDKQGTVTREKHCKRLEVATADKRGRLQSSYRTSPMTVSQYLTDCTVDESLERLQAIREASSDADDALQDMNAPKRAVKPSRTARGTAGAVQAWTAAIGDRVDVSKVVDADADLTMTGLYIRCIEIEEDNRVVCLLAPKASGKQPKAYTDCWYSAEDLTRYAAPKTSSRLRR